MNKTTKRLALTYNDALRFLEKAVAEKGEDYVYRPPSSLAPEQDGSCVYFDEQGPSCIVGHVFDYNGVTPRDLLDAAPSGNSLNVTTLRTSILDVDYDTLALLASVQNMQDDRVPWGRALEESVKWVEKLRERRGD